MLKKSAFTLALLLLLTGCHKAVPHYSGYHFDAMINDAHVIPLKNSDNIPSLKSYARTVRWQLDKPIGHEYSVKYNENINSKDFIGSIVRSESMEIISLKDTKLNVLNNKRLPSGEYVFRLKVHGTNNWDRKEIYVRIK